jgi:hypothetical protein
MPKTFLPQLIKLLEKVCRYIQKHHNTLSATLTPAQMAALDLIVQTCNTNFGNYNPNEQP